MKSYDEVVERLATSMFHSHMGGGSKYDRVISQIGIVAFIFGLTEDEVRKDADAVFRTLNNGFD